MKVFKFGGASVRSAEGVRNLAGIVAREEGPLVVIVSAMGKTTNAMERVLESFMAGDRPSAMRDFGHIEASHAEIIHGLFGVGAHVPEVEMLYSEVRAAIAYGEPAAGDYDLWYDRLVSYGELISTKIISEYLNSSGQQSAWLDMRRCFITDDRHRDANIDLELSGPLLRTTVEESGSRLFIGQGFIGATAAGETTTLGREGSDYSAAVAAYLLDARSVSIWKDVEGILNADPKIFPDTMFIPELTYLDAIELAYSGAQIIHPKTIKPLQNKNIPLYVRPFGDAAAPGSVIKGEMKERISVPILILKPNQILVSIRPKDFSFVLEERMGSIISTLEAGRVKINLVQSSAVNLTLCVDRSRNLQQAIESLGDDYRIVYNDDMQLLTIRGYTDALASYYADAPGVYLVQKTRKIIRLVRKAPQ